MTEDIDTSIRHAPIPEAKAAVPIKLEDALDPAWLGQALAPLSGGSVVEWVGISEKLETVAAKIRFKVRFAGDPTVHYLCMKAFFGDHLPAAGATAVREAKFYSIIAPHITTRTPKALSIIDDDAQRAILIMEDLIEAKAHFCSALEPFTADMAAQTLDQIARLHVASELLALNAWIPSRLSRLATNPHFTVKRQQELMNHPRFAKLSARTRDAVLLFQGIQRLRDRFEGEPLTILHGDCHAGNFYLTNDGPGLTDWQVIQRGHWAQDVAYHIAAVLPVDIAAREERALIDHYFDRLAAHGATVPDRNAGWSDYQAAQIYGYYMWAITLKVDPIITNVFVERLGAGVDRHRTYDVLGL